MPTFTKSTRAGKKYKVVTPGGKTVHFGASAMGHYKDRTGVGAWSHKDHGDDVRRKSYLARAKGIVNKQGQHTWRDPESANYYSVKYLW